MEEGSISIEAILMIIFWVVILVAFFYFGYRNDLKYRKRDSVYNGTWVMIGLLSLVCGYFYLAIISGALGGVLKRHIYRYLDDRKEDH